MTTAELGHHISDLSVDVRYAEMSPANLFM